MKKISLLLTVLFFFLLSGCNVVPTSMPPTITVVDPGTTITPRPPTRIVEVVVSETFKCVEYYNASGRPVLDSCQVGWKTEVGERYDVLAEFIVADGGLLYWEVYRGANDVYFDPGVFIRKDYTEIVR